jgi:hypothetical protein
LTDSEHFAKVDNRGSFIACLTMPSRIPPCSTWPRGSSGSRSHIWMQDALQVQGGWKSDDVGLIGWTDVRVDSTDWPLDMVCSLSAIDAAIGNQRCCFIPAICLTSEGPSRACRPLGSATTKGKCSTPRLALTMLLQHTEHVALTPTLQVWS